MWRAALLLVCVAACHHGKSSSGTTAGGKPLTAKDIFQRSTPAIVMIESSLDSDKQFGTGFILDKQGLVATNLHVVAGASQIKVKLKDGSQFDVVEIAGVDPNRDLAILHIAALKPLPVLRLGDSDQMNAGDTVYAIGNPLGVFDYSVSNGLVAARRNLCGQEEIAAKKCEAQLSLLQITAPISQGSSGGPLFNTSGEVVGVTTAIITGGQNINLAVPTNYLKPMLATPNKIGVAEFAEKTKALAHAEHGGGGGGDDGPLPDRQVPDLPVSTWDGCKQPDIEDTVRQISEAIEIGAPLYNQKTQAGFEGCFRVYEGTSIKLQEHGACKGVQAAFKDGLARAATIKSYRDKAWALRDTFDGLIKVAEKWCMQDAACKAKAEQGRPH